MTASASRRSPWRNWSKRVKARSRAGRWQTAGWAGTCHSRHGAVRCSGRTAGHLVADLRGCGVYLQVSWLRRMMRRCWRLGLTVRLAGAAAMQALQDSGNAAIQVFAAAAKADLRQLRIMRRPSAEPDRGTAWWLASPAGSCRDGAGWRRTSGAQFGHGIVSQQACRQCESGLARRTGGPLGVAGWSMAACRRSAKSRRGMLAPS